MVEKMDLKESRLLNEDELDKVVGGDSFVANQKCPWCKQYTIWDSGNYLYCKSCDYKSQEHS